MDDDDGLLGGIGAAPSKRKTAEEKNTKQKDVKLVKQVPLARSVVATN